MVALNALAIDPGRSWKGPWRWFSEELLDCCVGLDEIRRRGLVLDELACLARCNGATVGLHRADREDLARWRAALAGAASGAFVIIASYDRGRVEQTGGGHFSPIGGYHAARDLVLVLDVARFKYPPHWISAEKLWRAMATVDPDTGRARGWLELRSDPRVALGVSLSCEGADPHAMVARLATVLAERPPDADLGELARQLEPQLAHLVIRAPVTEVQTAALAEARAALHALPGFQGIVDAVGPARAEAVTLLMLATADPVTGARADLHALVTAAERHEPLASLLHHLRAQVGALRGLPPEG